MFFAVSLFAVLFVVCLKAGFLVAIGVVLATAAVVWTVRFQRRGYFLIPRVFVAVLSLTAIWFLAVDWSWHIYECPRCMTTRDIAEYRVLGFAVQSDVVVERTIFDRAFEDLGFPCSHPSWSDFYKHRWWGLQICACPCWNGTMGFIGENDRYTGAVGARVRGIAETRPEFAREVVSRMANSRDFRFFWDALMTDVFAGDILAQSATKDAIEWLRDSSPTMPRHIAQYDLEQSFMLVEELYDAGALEVHVVEPQEEVLDVGHPYTLAEDEEAELHSRVNQDSSYGQRCSRLLVKLPQDTAQRKRLIALADSKEQFRAKYPTADGGQEYLEMDLSW